MSTGRDNALALDRANGPHIANSDSRHPDVYLRYANFNAFDRQIENADIGISSNARAAGISLALGSTGSPHISYTFDYNGPPQHAWKQFPPTRWVYLPALRVH